MPSVPWGLITQKRSGRSEANPTAAKVIAGESESASRDLMYDRVGERETLKVGAGEWTCFQRKRGQCYRATCAGSIG